MLRSLSTKTWFIPNILRFIFCCVGIVLSLHGYCSASKSVSNKALKTNSTALSNVKSSNKTATPPYIYIRRRSLHNEIAERSFSPRSVNRAGGNGVTRHSDSAKLKTVCKLLEKALGSLKDLSQKSPKGPGGRIPKLKDKSPKSKPSFCYFPACGCGGCCLMRPMIMYKVKYTPPKFKIKPLKAKPKCGHPHYGVYLGRKRR